MGLLHCIRKIKAFAAVLLCVLPLSHAYGDDREDQVRVVINGLQSSWNAGDITGYLAAYHQDPTMSLTFGSTIVQGWDALNTLFRASYPDEARMGKFNIDELNVTILGDHSAIAYGNFTHIFIEETVIGGFSHALTRSPDGSWLIQHERTSRGEVIATD